MRWYCRESKEARATKTHRHTDTTLLRFDSPLVLSESRESASLGKWLSRRARGPVPVVPEAYCDVHFSKGVSLERRPMARPTQIMAMTTTTTTTDTMMTVLLSILPLLLEAPADCCFCSAVGAGANSSVVDGSGVGSETGRAVGLWVVGLWVGLCVGWATGTGVGTVTDVATGVTATSRVGRMVGAGMTVGAETGTGPDAGTEPPHTATMVGSEEARAVKADTDGLNDGLGVTGALVGLVEGAADGTLTGTPPLALFPPLAALPLLPEAEPEPEPEGQLGRLRVVGVPRGLT